MDRKSTIVASLIGILPAAWIGLLIAPAVDGSIAESLAEITKRLENPLHIEIVPGSLKAAALMVCIYLMGICIYLSTRHNYRKGEEHGSAKWGDAGRLCRKYAKRRSNYNKILTQNVRMNFNGRKHRRNLNTIVIGGSGAGKTRFFCKPNLLQANTSYVVLDPKGELIESTGQFLETMGYEVRVLDLLHMERSHCYNPFVYLRNDNDVQRLVTNLFKATTPKGSTESDPFWNTAAQMLLLALIFYLKYEAPEEEQNFAMVMEMIRAGEVDEEDGTLSALDNLFYDLRRTDPQHIAIKYYDAYHSGAAKTLKSIQITLASRLEKFNLESLASLTITDELDLPSLGEKKTALFALIPDNDTSFNFLISVLYTQIFQQLFENADNRPGKRLPVHVHFLMDEFSNVSLPDDFAKILSVMRSREVSVSIILQNMAQLKALFEKEWESITGNTDELVYLGGNELSTHKYISELLGKETIDTNSYGRTTGRSGSWSKNDQIMGRDLMTPDEVRMLDNQYAILVIRGEPPIKDLKYDLMKHPNIGLTADGGAAPYVHGEARDVKYTISLTSDLPEEMSDEELAAALQGIAGTSVEQGEADAQEDEISYVLLSEEDIEKEYVNQQ